MKRFYNDRQRGEANGLGMPVTNRQLLRALGSVSTRLGQVPRG